MPILIVVLTLLIPTNSLDGTTKYWIFFADKPETHGKGRAPLVTDPVSPAYVDQVRRLGAVPIVESRWLNAISAELSDSLANAVAVLPFVSEVRPVRAYDSGISSAGPVPIDPGQSRTQLENANVLPVLERGINGEGVRIGFLDAEYGDFEHPVFARMRSENRLIATRNFTGVVQTKGLWWHGMAVASVAVGYLEGSLLGPAWGAEVLAATTEVVQSESRTEEDFFVAGLEWLVEQGADVVNISLSYTTFDDPADDHSYADLDGDTALPSIAVDIASDLGVVVVVSAGNSGSCGTPEGSCFYYVGSPADAQNAITVGGTDPDGTNRFTAASYGPTSDGRTKPDVAAQAQSVVAALPSSNATGLIGGTSFSSPMVAGIVCQILQVNPELTPGQVREVLRTTASQNDSPDNAMGWGVVNAEAAVDLAESMKHTAIESRRPAHSALRIFPNPSVGSITVEHPMDAHDGSHRLVMYDMMGRRVGTHEARRHRTLLDVSHLPAGVYLVTYEGVSGRKSTSLMVGY